MGDFEDAIRLGFEASLDEFGTEIRHAGLVARCVASEITGRVAQISHGMLPEFATSVQMFGTDLARLGIVDRSIVEISGRSLRVIAIRTDDADPVATLDVTAER